MYTGYASSHKARPFVDNRLALDGCPPLSNVPSACVMEPVPLVWLESYATGLQSRCRSVHSTQHSVNGCSSNTA